MAALLQIPSIKNATAFHLERWRKVCADPSLQRLPDRIETNRYGHIVMMPPPGFTHSNLQLEIGHLLKILMNGGRALTECAVLTSDGVKGVDAAWISESRVKRGLKDDVLTIAPEICVEVISPGNTRQEMENKRELYFAAGAEEVWFCDQKGALHFFLKGSAETAAKASVLCPSMPKRVKV
ncbi:Uma2 family endonuclease [Prosthecobacter sp.]|uniref:Uma2 family endonuclease n=1 Tax=Prosthecobacter sp. TaxID=1965333 RepID=UPI003784E269